MLILLVWLLTRDVMCHLCDDWCHGDATFQVLRVGRLDDDDGGNGSTTDAPRYAQLVHSWLIAKVRFNFVLRQNF